MAESSIYFILCTRDRKPLNKIIQCEGYNNKNLYQKSSGLKKVTFGAIMNGVVLMVLPWLAGLHGHR